MTARETMTKKERVRAALRGDPVDHVPVSLWGHDFLREWSAEDLAAQTLEAYRAHDWDFIKLNPRWTFFGEAWGNEYQPPTEQRFPRLTRRVVESTADLARIEPVDPAGGVLGQQLEALRMIVTEVGTEVDVLYTVFSPLSVVGLICGGVGEPLTSYAAQDPALVHSAIATVAAVLDAHARLALQAGAAGLFYAPLQWSSRRVCSPGFYREHGRPYDLQILQSVRGAEFNVLHVCGDENMLDEFLDYPVPALNWADRGDGNPSLAEARTRTDLTLMGGIEHNRLHRASEEDVRAQAAEALATGPEGLILAGGCGVPPVTPASIKDAIVAAARG
ncbi:MAG: uroporphyrinogen decarboxylase family protein [Dehalococcoidia bacterium]